MRTSVLKMRLITAVSALALSSVALAQDPIVVQVGAGGLKFDPQFINVTQPNTVVTFQFVAANHSVAQSSFATPCEPLQDGFNSGFAPVGNGTGFWNLTVTDVTSPIWFYCPQQAREPLHCTAGMVGAINGDITGQDVNAFVSAAESATTIVTPNTALSGVNALATDTPVIVTSLPPTPLSSANNASPVTVTLVSTSILTVTTVTTTTSNLTATAPVVGAPAPSSNVPGPDNAAATNNAGSTMHVNAVEAALLAIALSITVL